LWCGVVLGGGFGVGRAVWGVSGVTWQGGVVVVGRGVLCWGVGVLPQPLGCVLGVTRQPFLMVGGLRWGYCAPSPWPPPPLGWSVPVFGRVLGFCNVIVTFL